MVCEKNHQIQASKMLELQVTQMMSNPPLTIISEMDELRLKRVKWLVEGHDAN